MKAPGKAGAISANTVLHDGSTRGFRAIHKMSNVRFLSGVIWGNSWVMRWRHCWQVGTPRQMTLCGGLLRRKTVPAFHRKRSPFDV
jgi:hypothetical protein